MSKKPAVFLYAPEELEGDNVQNAHVFDGSFDTESRKWSHTSPSRCGKVRISGSHSSLIREIDEQSFCHQVVNGHGTTFNACGMCMASFFADDDD